jgi:Protein of unknown function (DUF4054)
MALDLATFRAQRPEFDQTEDTIVQMALEDAAAQMDAATFGAKFDLAQSFLAAHLLAKSPFGHSARLEEGSESIYWGEFVRIRRAVTPRFLVL